ncbi:hypothetical protein K449DRAFT_51317 [Hypoxylon sp. EC38]|nr:hypothetical protein K449DRAFT_51317 [Hypoxylon sp. EC38]
MWAARSGGSFVVEDLLEKNADLWVRGHSYSTDWSPLKLANFHNRDRNIKRILVPQTLTRIGSNGKTEKWDEFFHKSRIGDSKGIKCWSCFVKIVGIQWKCIECTHDVSLCFKCYSHRSTMHNPEHNFEEIGPLYDDDSTSSGHSSSGDLGSPEHEKDQSTDEALQEDEESAVSEENRDNDDAPIPSDNVSDDDAEFDPDTFDINGEDTIA